MQSYKKSDKEMVVLLPNTESRMSNKKDSISKAEFSLDKITSLSSTGLKLCELLSSISVRHSSVCKLLGLQRVLKFKLYNICKTRHIVEKYVMH